jgi:hypothetical protein
MGSAFGSRVESLESLSEFSGNHDKAFLGSNEATRIAQQKDLIRVGRAAEETARRRQEEQETIRKQREQDAIRNKLDYNKYWEATRLARQQDEDELLKQKVKLEDILNDSDQKLKALQDEINLVQHERAELANKLTHNETTKPDDLQKTLIDNNKRTRWVRGADDVLYPVGPYRPPPEVPALPEPPAPIIQAQEPGNYKDRRGLDLKALRPVQPLIDLTGEPPAPVLVSYSKQLADVSKSFRKEDEWDGFNGPFQQKLQIFDNVCRRCGLPEDQKISAMDVMLTKMARDHFISMNLFRGTYQNAIQRLQAHFEGPNYTAQKEQGWANISLTTVIAKSPDKTLKENLIKLISKLYNIQAGLDIYMQGEKPLYTKLLSACRGVPACNFAVQTSNGNLMEFIAALQKSINSYESTLTTTSGTYLTNTPSHNQPHNHHYCDRHCKHEAMTADRLYEGVPRKE